MLLKDFHQIMEVEMKKTGHLILNGLIVLTLLACNFL